MRKANSSFPCERKLERDCSCGRRLFVCSLPLFKCVNGQLTSSVSKGKGVNGSINEGNQTLEAKTGVCGFYQWILKGGKIVT